jgi:hypothetical protein
LVEASLVRQRRTDCSTKALLRRLGRIFGNFGRKCDFQAETAFCEQVRYFSQLYLHKANKLRGLFTKR